MNKLPKFRVWNGMEMVYDVVVGRFGVFYVNPGDKGNGLDPNDSASLTPFNTRYPNGTPLMQFTGLHDKEGKEIYKGDFIQDGAGNIMLVTWREDLASFSLRKDEWMYDHYFGEAVDAGHTTIIGNIHQNPELLESKAH